MPLEPDKIDDRKAARYNPGVKEGTDPTRAGLDTLWDIDDDLVGCVEDLEKEDIDSFAPEELVAFFEAHNCSDVLVRWSDSQVKTSRAEGKIPRLENWRDLLADKAIGLDSLMNLAGLNSFAADQHEMDDRVRKVLAGSGKSL
jgi:transaldolase